MRMQPPNRPHFSHRDAFSLVEMTMALGIAIFCLVALLGMLPLGLDQVKESSDELVALNLLTTILGDIETGSEENEPSPLFGIDVPVPGGAPMEVLLHGSVGGEIGKPGNVRTPFYLFRILMVPAVGTSSYKPTRLFITVLWPHDAPADSRNEVMIYAAVQPGI